MLPLPTPADLKAERLRLGLTQAALARAAGVSQPLVARVERGSVDPRLSTLSALADALAAAERRRPTLADVMTTDVVSVRPRDALAEAARTMRERGLGQVPVIDKGAAVGGLCEQDIVRTLARAKDPARAAVRDVMGPPLPAASPGDRVDVALRLLEGRPAVLVVERGRIVGIVARSDLFGLVR